MRYWCLVQIMSVYSQSCIFCIMTEAVSSHRLSLIIIMYLCIQLFTCSLLYIDMHILSYQPTSCLHHHQSFTQTTMNVTLHRTLCNDYKVQSNLIKSSFMHESAEMMQSVLNVVNNLGQRCCMSCSL